MEADCQRHYASFEETTGFPAMLTWRRHFGQLVRSNGGKADSASC